MNPKKQSYPLLSVIIPAYNAEKTLAKCLRSIIQASPKQKEVIVIDDGSTDHTYNLATEWPVKLLHLDMNRGASTAKNLGLAHASGDIVAFVDSDCVVDERYFTELSSALNRSECTIGGVGGVVYPLQSSLISESFNVRFFGCSPSSETRIREIDSVSGAASAYPKELLMKIGGFDVGMRGGEDLDLNVRLQKAGYKLLVVPLAKAYHLHPTLLRQLAKKWFSYGRLLVDVSIKNGLKKNVALSLGWVFSLVALLVIALSTRQLLAWLLPLSVFCLPWTIYYGKETVKFWIRTRKARYVALPFIHQVVIISRSLGVVVATFTYLFKTLTMRVKSA